MYVCTFTYSNYVNYILAIDRVTGVTLTCRSVGLINQCTVLWNVSLYTLLRFSVMSNKLNIHTYMHIHANQYLCTCVILQSG